VFIAAFTTWPSLSAWLLSRKATVGPGVYNTCLPPLALTVFALMGVAPLLGWRKTSPELFRKSFRWPLGVMFTTAALHLLLGKRLGFPAFIQVDPILDGGVGVALSRVASTYPLPTVALVAFNFTVVVQEFVRGVRARRKNGEESVLASLFNLVSKSRRRYGGYIVHVGIAVMFLGFVGRGWSEKMEISLSPGEQVSFKEYTMTYLGPRMEVDHEKRMLFADVDVHRYDRKVETLHPAKFIYKTMGGEASSEVARHITLRNDLYLVIGMVNPQTKIAALQIHVNQLISFIWLGGFILFFGAVVAWWPDIALEEAGAFGYIRAAASVATAVMFGLILAGASGQAYGATSPPRGPPVTIATEAGP